MTAGTAPSGVRDHGQVHDLIAFLRKADTREALGVAVPAPAADDLARHLDFAHGALLVVACSVDRARRDLVELGVRPGVDAPSVVVRSRVAERLGVPVAEVDVRILSCDVDGGRVLELFVLVDPDGVHGALALDEHRYGRESHLAFEARTDDPLVLRGVHRTLVGPGGLVPDGGGYNGHEDASVLYFRGVGRIELHLPGRSDLLDEHLGLPDRHRRDMLELMTGAWRTQAVAVAAELGVADHLAAGPLATPALAALVGAREDNLRRLLRFLAALGVVEADGDAWSCTPRGALLASDAEGSQRDLARVYGGFFYRSFGQLLHTVRTGECAFTEVFGAEPFDHFAANPADARLFEGAMAAGTGFLKAVPAALDLPERGTVVDVAGGDGHLLALVLAAAPGLRGVLFDRPHVIATAGAVLDGYGCRDRVSLAEGDFFRDPVPAGGSLYLLSRILHDWDDERCSTILRNIRSAITGPATLVLVERPVPETHLEPLPLAYDVHMMVNNVQGRERSPGEYRELLRANGFELTDVRPLALDMAVLAARPV
ncbi:methyltransferase [Actinosynnema sp. NPDC020468]|uniref:methyltransferase n=1 Tax=Actinosynnema sp. NPDC020468 TaxID=3154488 RepID=UPI0033E17552